MARVQVAGLVGDVNNPIENRVRRNGAYAAPAQTKRPVTVAPPLRKKDYGGCKTCDGLHCVGHCKF
jgi:hypothetical protein